MTQPPDEWDDDRELGIEQMEPEKENAASFDFAVATETEVIRKMWKNEHAKSFTVYGMPLLRLCRSYRRLYSPPIPDEQRTEEDDRAFGLAVKYDQGYGHERISKEDLALLVKVFLRDYHLLWNVIPLVRRLNANMTQRARMAARP
jgi:hypothetical protein